MVLENGLQLSDSEEIDSQIKKALDINPHPYVVVRCITFNHVKYIKECLDGFVSQVTKFKFLVIVHDDASTDGTSDIVKEYAEKYPDIIVGLCDKTNRYSEKSLGWLMDAATNEFNPKYVAICEGDDVWINPNKLQLQVDYMDKNDSCVMCHGDYIVINGGKKKRIIDNSEPYFAPGHIISYGICTLTTLFRYAEYKKCPQYKRNHNWLMGDLPLWIELSRFGEFHYLDEVLGAYRVLPNSASHSSNCEQIIRFWQSANDIIEFYCKEYNYEYEPRSLKSLYLEIQKQCCGNRDIEQAKKYWKEGSRNKANSLKAYFFYFINIHKLYWVLNLIYKILR